MRLALLQEDPGQAERLRRSFESAGHDCHHFACGEVLLQAVDRVQPDAVVLDWNLQGMSGIDVLNRIRDGDWRSVPVLFLSGRSHEDDVVTALRLGADDYVVKPARWLELLARLEAVIRRGKHDAASPMRHLEVGAYRIELECRTILWHGQPVNMTAKEFDLSWLLFRNVGRLLSRSLIVESVWGNAVRLSSRTLDTHISRVRNKLALTPENGWRFAAVYGHGYRLDAVGQGASPQR